jgi:hypothetical protein
MKTLLLTDADFSHLQEILSGQPEIACQLLSLSSLKYSLEHELPAMPPVWDVYEALRSAQGNTQYPEDYAELSAWLEAALPAIQAWIAANVSAAKNSAKGAA